MTVLRAWCGHNNLCLTCFVDSAKLESDDIDALDAYMTAIKSGAMDTKTRMKIKRQIFDLRKEQQRLQKLVNIAKPASMPELKKCVDCILTL